MADFFDIEMHGQSGVEHKSLTVLGGVIDAAAAQGHLVPKLQDSGSGTFTNGNGTVLSGDAKATWIGRHMIEVSDPLQTYRVTSAIDTVSFTIDPVFQSPTGGSDFHVFDVTDNPLIIYPNRVMGGPLEEL